MIKEQFGRELDYAVKLRIADKMAEVGLISEKEHRIIRRKILKSSRPIIGGLNIEKAAK